MSHNSSEEEVEQMPKEIKLVPQKNIPSLTIEQISSVLEPYFSPNQFEESVFKYLATMIQVDHPENENDLRSLIGDYLSDSLKYPENLKSSICKEIYSKLYKDQQKSASKAIIAERLDNPIRLCDIHVGSYNQIKSLNFDPNEITFRLDKYYTESENPSSSKKPVYVADKARIKEMNVFIANMKREKELALLEVELNHNKDESHRVDINVPAFTIQIGGKTLIEDATLKIAFGRKYFLIGRNGVGKTTLLNYIARKEIDGIPKHIQVVHVEQEVIMTDNGLLDEVLSCDKERTDLLKESNEINALISKEKDEKELKKLSSQLVKVNKRLEDIDAQEAENKAKFILLGLGFKEKDFQKKTKDFSGGWRVRISLAKALFVKPDLLLLDEPTNHLDMNAVMWLEDYLNSWPYTLIIVSHAKDFINNVATDIIHLQNTKLNYYKGSYDNFLKARTEKVKLNKRVHDAQVRKIEHMQEFIDRFRYKAKRAAMVQSRIKQINKMEIVEEILDDPSVIFLFPEPDKINPPVLRLDNANLGYNNKAVIEKVNLSLDMSSRIALVGVNGCGKTTLLKGLEGSLMPLKGLSYRHGKLRLGLLKQHHVDQLDLELSPVEVIQKYHPEIETEKIRSHLGKYGISGNLALRPNYLLSGGQKSRVAMSLVMIDKPQILLMDEPTNHLDLDAINALAIALNSYTGGLLIVSHDQNFVEQVCNQIYMIEDGSLKQFRGNFNDYRKYLRAQNEGKKSMKLKI